MVDKGDRYCLKWFYNACDTQKTFVISYQIGKAVLIHQDIAEFYWQLIGDQWGKGVSLVKATVFLPTPGVDNPENIYGFGHGPRNGVVNIPNAQEITFEVKSLHLKLWGNCRSSFPLRKRIKLVGVLPARVILAVQRR